MYILTGSLACLECIRVSSIIFAHSLALSVANSTGPRELKLRPSSPKLVKTGLALLSSSLMK